jgi:hypothetical protein
MSLDEKIEEIRKRLDGVERIKKEGEQARRVEEIILREEAEEK